VSELAELSGFSKSYISQVKNGKCPPSQRLLDSLVTAHEPTRTNQGYLTLFLQSRQAIGVSLNTIRFYRERLSKYIALIDVRKVTRRQINAFLNSIPPNSNGYSTRHASYRAIKTYHHWLNKEHGLPNPMNGLPAPIMSKPILPSLDQAQVLQLIAQVSCVRDKAIIALFAESGLRLSELASVGVDSIDWDAGTIRVMGKGRKEAYAPFGNMTRQYLTEWFNIYTPDGNVWGMNKHGIISMLRRLQETTGITCNPHTFRRTFACLLRKQGLDSLTIKDLGRWESVDMVQRYTRSITFQDSLKFYHGVL
jgi:site-specific recombinase XerD